MYVYIIAIQLYKILADMKKYIFIAKSNLTPKWTYMRTEMWGECEEEAKSKLIKKGFHVKGLATPQ